MSNCCYRGCEGCAEYANAPKTTRTAEHAVRDWRAMSTDDVNAAFRELGAAIQRVRDLHVPETEASLTALREWRVLCAGCLEIFPCRTIRTLDGAVLDGGRCDTFYSDASRPYPE